MWFLDMFLLDMWKRLLMAIVWLLYLQDHVFSERSATPRIPLFTPKSGEGQRSMWNNGTMAMKITKERAREKA